MAKSKQAVVATPEAAPVGGGTLRKCIGSKRFGIEAHEAPAGDFPVQPSQKDGLGRMCKTHWNQYTAGLARDAKARTAAEGGPVPEASVPEPEGSVPTPKAKAPRAGKGGPIGYIGSEPGGPAEILPGGKKRRIASTPKGTRSAAKREAAHLPSANSQGDAG
jgi:hypothetical protein